MLGAAGKGHAPEEWRSQRVVQEQDRRVERLILQKMMVSSLDQVDAASCTRHTEMWYHPVWPRAHPEMWYHPGWRPEETPAAVVSRTLAVSP